MTFALCMLVVSIIGFIQATPDGCSDSPLDRAFQEAVRKQK